jgi:UDP-N-acetylglucosamine--N-acetylmuramyl-(pentapeptide) pyrophosphoryl-undecaprenol N-acetylglucosamine transferase
VQVGIPIRKELRTAAHLKSPAKVRPLVLVLGGIQGAMAINNFLADSLSEILKVADVVHSTGPVEVKKFEKLRDELPEKVRSQYRPFGFIGRELPYYYQLADLIVSRASATTVAEAATFSKPVYLIPLPTSAGDHQNINAQKLSEVNAAEVRNQADLSGKQFAKDVGNLLNNHDKLAELGQNLKKYFNEEKSVDECVEIITSYLPKENNGH